MGKNTSAENTAAAKKPAAKKAPAKKPVAKKTAAKKPTAAEAAKAAAQAAAKAAEEQAAAEAAAKAAEEHVIEEQTTEASEKTAEEKVVENKVVKKTKVLFVASEASPFISTGGMGQVVGALSAAIKDYSEDYDVRVICPYYAQIRDRFGAGMEYKSNSTVYLSWRGQYCGVFQAERDGIIYYFVDNMYYFDRTPIYGYFDDGERFAFFSKAVFSVIEQTGFVPDIIHAHDWQTALVPIYLKTRFKDIYPGVRSVFTMHNMEYQGKYDPAILTDVFDLMPHEKSIVEYDKCINLMKGAIVCADKLTTVSPSYAMEIQSGGGYGLEAIISENAYKLSGIINGIDTKLYDPATDRLLENHYTIDNLENKAQNKLKLQSLFGIPKAPRKMLICMVTRLVAHKGLDIITYMMDELLNLDVQFLLLGTGDHEYELFFSEKAVRHPEKVGVSIAYNPEIASLIYAGADVVLMPSSSEPCGLTQMIACRYGTVPIVRKTGGLGDTIRDCRYGAGNGFVFEEYSSTALLSTISQALDIYTYREDDWKNLMREAMRSDFSWSTSAKAYADIYAELYAGE